jgi:uncharacterized lipoprotein YajG
MKKLSVIVLSLVFLAGCKKEYQCKCVSPDGMELGGSITATRKKAEKMCKGFYPEDYVCTVK